MSDVIILVRRAARGWVAVVRTARGRVRVSAGLEQMARRAHRARVNSVAAVAGRMVRHEAIGRCAVMVRKGRGASGMGVAHVAMTRRIGQATAPTMPSKRN